MPIDTAHSYPVSAHEATLRLESFLSEQIRKNGAISFYEFMHHSLYHPKYGYYTRGNQNIGRSGDFFTSVSVGKCFGIILAHRIHKLWIEQASPNSFHLIEIAANNGQLACDILETIQQTFPDFYRHLTYHIIEPLESIREIQLQKLKAHADKLELHHISTDILESHGVILSNELIDAFPFHLLQFEKGQWHERTVAVEQENFNFSLNKNLTDEINIFTQSLPCDLPDGYQTEFRPSIDSHVAETTKILRNFHTITIDYGHSYSSYYAPSRNTGTFRCYYQHQADDNPLETPGSKDITAHVDFTQLGKAYLQHCHRITHFSSQAHYLTTYAKDWLLTLEKDLNPENFKLIRQFQTLIHPTTMGHQFHVLETAYYEDGKLENDSIALDKLEITPL